MERETPIATTGLEALAKQGLSNQQLQTLKESAVRAKAKAYCKSTVCEIFEVRHRLCRWFLT